jgi:dihydrofolate reductase
MVLIVSFAIQLPVSPSNMDSGQVGRSMGRAKGEDFRMARGAAGEDVLAAWHSGAMGKTQYYTATTLDGYIADPNNSLDWLFVVDRETDGFGDFFAQVGAFAMGATTYEWVLDHEKVGEQPEKWRAWYGDVPCWVFTHRTLPAVPGANITFVSGDVRPVHAAMAEAAQDKNIWLVGGGELVGMFADEGLLDEIIAGVAPVTLGGGAPLLPRKLTSARLTLKDVRRNGQFAELTYALGAHDGSRPR